MSKGKEIVNSIQFQLMIERLSFQLLENHGDFKDTSLVGIQPRGSYLSKRIGEKISSILSKDNLKIGNLDITFFRDDFRRRLSPIKPQKIEMNFSIEDQKIVLIDDVLFTGRSVRAALDALINLGRPKQVELMVLIDRRLSRDLPIEPNYVGKTVDSIFSERVHVQWKETHKKDKIMLFNS